MTDKNLKKEGENTEIKPLTITRGNVFIKFAGITIYYPSLTNAFSLIVLIAFIISIIFIAIFFANNYPKKVDGIFNGMRNIKISAAIFFDDSNENNEQTLRLSKNIKEILKNDEGKRLQISFWTPDEDTWSSIRTVTERNDWQKDIDKEKNIEFMNEIYKPNQVKKSIFSGLRNYKVCGRGSETYKCGLWWVATASKDIQLNEFLEKYQKFWDNSPGVYIELNIVNSQRIN